MTHLKQLLAQNQAGLTVYSPDCTHSRLWGHIDQAIHKATGFQIGRRQWVNHDINSIMRFYQEEGDEVPPEQDPAEARQKYDNIPVEILQSGHLVVKLLMQGPSLVTIWQGEDAIPTLLKVKGKTQPAEAGADTVRGRFWCDNGVCNLMHSSDDTAAVKRELAALNLTHWLEEILNPLPLIPPISLPTAHIPHSAISTVCELVNRLLQTTADDPLSIQLPPSGDARETNQQLTALLRQTAAQQPTLAPFINAFLSGDLPTTTNLLQSLPATRWEYFVLQCGVLNRDKWQTATAA